MKKTFLFVALLILITTYAFAHGGNDVILHGIIVDNACAQTHKDNLSEFTKTHEKTCMLKPDCLKSGYSIYAEEDKQLHKFDEASNAKVVDFLKRSDSRVDIVIIAEKNGDALMIEHISNRRIVR